MLHMPSKHVKFFYSKITNDKATIKPRLVTPVEVVFDTFSTWFRCTTLLPWRRSVSLAMVVYGSCVKRFQGKLMAYQTKKIQQMVVHRTKKQRHGRRCSSSTEVCYKEKASKIFVLRKNCDHCHEMRFDFSSIESDLVIVQI